MRILVDTNVLLALVDGKVDFAQLIRNAYLDAELFVLRQSLAELKRERPSAFALVKGYLEKNRVGIAEGEGKADNLIVEWALRENGIVATLDSGLKKRLKKAGAQVISFKNNKLVL